MGASKRGQVDVEPLRGQATKVCGQAGVSTLRQVVGIAVAELDVADEQLPD